MYLFLSALGCSLPFAFLCALLLLFCLLLVDCCFVFLIVCLFFMLLFALVICAVMFACALCLMLDCRLCALRVHVFLLFCTAFGCFWLLLVDFVLAVYMFVDSFFYFALWFSFLRLALCSLFCVCCLLNVAFHLFLAFCFALC
eukprot:gnl/MRDRNA2_/MRDRNA2_173656_c0_seq1.p1 gnl/MRDRNA2_/MRDRNA2_173656_c0~~gnl/MRDRNA2_/MRDRNA2_173656_c0_seq1.p1  ORF type:complete len:143 (-),score=0.04 gnl/MRDRNA2_/MRDRNA2_173656_c0_seq1:124-552(-)